MLLTGTVPTGSELLRPGWIEVDDGVVTAVGAGTPPRPADRDLGAVTVVPGFVDTHARRRGVAALSVAAQTAEAVALHRRHGTTTLVASLVTESSDDLRRQVGELADQVRAGLIAGIHRRGRGWPRAVALHDPALRATQSRPNCSRCSPPRTGPSGW